ATPTTAAWRMLEAGPAPEEPEAVPEEDRRYHREVMERILQEPAAPPREPVPEEEAEQEPPVPAGGDIDMLREVESLGGEIEQAGPAPPEEAQVPGGPGVSRRPAPQEIPPSAEEPGYPGEPAVAEHAEAPGEALVPERIAEQVRDYLAGGRTVDLVNLFFSVQQREGHERFTALLAEAFTGIGQGTGTLLFTAHRDRYELECRHDAGEEPVPWRKRSFRKKSALARCLREQGRVLSSDEELGREVEKELSSFEAFQPYAAVPVQVGEELVGFALVAGLREAVPAHQLLLLANTAALNLYSFVLEKNLQESLDRLLEENRELHSIMDLYRYGELGSMSLDDVLAAAAGNFGIESAVITGNWDGKGSVTVLASLGLSEKGIKKYRVAKSDKELKGVIRKGDPAVLGGMDERLSRLPEQDRQGMNTFIAAPVLFDGRTLAVLMIHRMKGVNRHLSSRQAALVRNIAQSLTPFLLYRRMVEMEPLEVFEALLEREAAEARKTRVPLHVTAFRIKNYKAIITSQGFTTYRQRLDRFCSRISKAAGAAAHVVALNKVVLLIRDSDQERVNQTIKKVKDAVRAMAGKEKAKLPLSYTPMRTVFPNDSKSVADIMQVIE
ncbi:MAG: GAF domain-containing protein, partial [Spirochaetota bacterium]